MLDGQPGGVELPQLLAQHGQQLDGGLLHVEEIPQHRGRLVKVAGGDGVGHLEHHRVQLRGGHGVDVLPGHPVVPGIGPDLADLGDQVVHQVAAQEDQVLGVLGADVVIQGPEPAGDPVDQVPLALAVEGHHAPLLLQQGGQPGAGV